ncbi:MAG: hypothetical protein ACLPVY_27625 [Acidimicrobiia bacterium]
MAFSSSDTSTVVDVFLLALIGIGPKDWARSFVRVTSAMDDATKRGVAHKMIGTASAVAAAL